MTLFFFNKNWSYSWVNSVTAPPVLLLPSASYSFLCELSDGKHPKYSKFATHPPASQSAEVLPLQVYHIMLIVIMESC